jgi:hypothetical protein
MFKRLQEEEDKIKAFFNKKFLNMLANFRATLHEELLLINQNNKELKKKN